MNLRSGDANFEERVVRTCSEGRPVTWFTYVVRCGDGTLYTGSTNDLERRVRMHNKGAAARYTRGRGPVTLVWSQIAISRSAACALESRIKRMRREAKEELVGGPRGRRHLGR